MPFPWNWNVFSTKPFRFCGFYADDMLKRWVVRRLIKVKIKSCRTHTHCCTHTHTCAHTASIQQFGLACIPSTSRTQNLYWTWSTLQKEFVKIHLLENPCKHTLPLCGGDVIYIWRVVTWGLSLATPNKSDGSLPRVTCSSHPPISHKPPTSPFWNAFFFFMNCACWNPFKTTDGPLEFVLTVLRYWGLRTAFSPMAGLSFIPWLKNPHYRKNSQKLCATCATLGIHGGENTLDVKAPVASQSVPFLKTVQHFRCKTKGCCGHWLMPLLLSPLIKTHHLWWPWKRGGGGLERDICFIWPKLVPDAPPSHFQQPGTNARHLGVGRSAWWFMYHLTSNCLLITSLLTERLINTLL